MQQFRTSYTAITFAGNSIAAVIASSLAFYAGSTTEEGDPAVALRCAVGVAVAVLLVYLVRVPRMGVYVGEGEFKVVRLVGSYRVASPATAEFQVRGDRLHKRWIQVRNARGKFVDLTGLTDPDPTLWKWLYGATNELQVRERTEAHPLSGQWRLTGVSWSHDAAPHDVVAHLVQSATSEEVSAPSVRYGGLSSEEGGREPVTVRTPPPRSLYLLSAVPYVALALAIVGTAVGSLLLVIAGFVFVLAGLVALHRLRRTLHR